MKKINDHHYTNPENNVEPMGHHKRVLQTGREDFVKLITIMNIES